MSKATNRDLLDLDFVKKNWNLVINEENIDNSPKSKSSLPRSWPQPSIACTAAFLELKLNSIHFESKLSTEFWRANDAQFISNYDDDSSKWVWRVISELKCWRKMNQTRPTSTIWWPTARWLILNWWGNWVKRSNMRKSQIERSFYSIIGERNLFPTFFRQYE